ncbi:TIGR03618 family F420-dependent PPOX class oxidoreductase [Pseudonocardia bannensis]|uniref:TIGR03618 family F420-dependent PPOX class oxidoreductase n=1 Tax=Pseudonocardia bannensis TaxID=630973 RepID=A0A848DCI3_9PSEU|nr:TIGR03618 family F420-dependent PPOX class oxidoreductase [Pseudonocardia bannensis]NMH90301.1 TIGR03618 family F420-dependent PPOX class oxidoreductase [Pseudonocardia bannensis]
MGLLPETARELIDSGRLAHCTTLNADGSPQVGATWIGLDGDDVIMAHLGHDRRTENLRRDPRIALSLDGEARNDIGMQVNLVLYGRATVTEGGAADVLRRLAKVYGGPDAKFPVPPDAPGGYVVRVTVDRVRGVGPWATH